MLPPAQPEPEDTLTRYQILFSWLKAQFNIPTANDPARWQQEFLRITQSFRQKMANLPEIEEIPPRELDYCAFYLTLLKQKQDISRFQFERKVQCSIHTSLYSLLGRPDAANLFDLPAWKDEPTFIINIMRKQDYAQPLSHFEIEYPFPIQLPPVPLAELIPYSEIDARIAPILQELLGEVILNRPFQEKVLQVFHDIFAFIQDHHMKKSYNDRVLIGILIFSIRIVVGHNMDAIFPSIRHVLRIYNRLHPRTIIPLSYRFTESRRLIDAYHKFKEDTPSSSSSKSVFATQVATKNTSLNSTQMGYTSSIQYGIVPLPFELFRVMEAYNDPMVEFLNFLIKITDLETDMEYTNSFNEGIQFDRPIQKVDRKKVILGLAYGENWVVYYNIVRRFYPFILTQLQTDHPEWLEEYDSLEISSILFMVGKTICPWFIPDQRPYMRIHGKFAGLTLSSLLPYFSREKIDRLAKYIHEKFYQKIVNNTFFTDPKLYQISPQKDVEIFRTQILSSLAYDSFNRILELKGKTLAGESSPEYFHIQPLLQKFQASLNTCPNIVTFKEEFLKHLPLLPDSTIFLNTIDAQIQIMAETYTHIERLNLPFSAIQIAERMQIPHFESYLFTPQTTEARKTAIWDKISNNQILTLYDLDFLELFPDILKQCVSYCHTLETDTAKELLRYFPSSVFATTVNDQSDHRENPQERFARLAKDVVRKYGYKRFGDLDPNTVLQFFLQCENASNRDHSQIQKDPTDVVPSVIGLRNDHFLRRSLFEIINYPQYLGILAEPKDKIPAPEISLNIWFALELYQGIQREFPDYLIEEYEPYEIILVCYLMVEFRYILTHKERESVKLSIFNWITPKSILHYVDAVHFSDLMHKLFPYCKSYRFPQFGHISFEEHQNRIVNSCMISYFIMFLFLNNMMDFEIEKFSTLLGIKNTEDAPNYIIPLFPSFDLFLDSEETAEIYFAEIYTCIRHFAIPIDGLVMKDICRSRNFVKNSYSHFPTNMGFPLLPPLQNNLYPSDISSENEDEQSPRTQRPLDCLAILENNLNLIWMRPATRIVQDMITKIYTQKPPHSPAVTVTYAFCHHERNLILFWPDVINPLIEEFKKEINSVLHHHPIIHENDRERWYIYFRHLIEILHQAKEQQCSPTPEQQIAENPFLDRILKVAVINDRLDELDRMQSGWQTYAPLIYAIAVHYGRNREPQLTYEEMKELTRPYLTPEFIDQISHTNSSDFRQLLQVVSDHQSEEFNTFLVHNLPTPTATEIAQNRMVVMLKEIFFASVMKPFDPNAAKKLPVLTKKFTESFLSEVYSRSNNHQNPPFFDDSNISGDIL